MPVEISFSEEEVRTLLTLVQQSLKEKAEEIRLDDLERASLGLAQDEPKRAESFSQGVLALIRSDLAGLYRNLFAQQRVETRAETLEEVPVEAPEEPTGEAIEGY